MRELRRRIGPAIAIVALVLATLALVGCPRPARSTLKPEAVLSRYAQAVKAGRYDDAYDLMSLEFRKRYDRRDFVRMLKENPEEVKLSVEQLQGKPREVKVVAKLDYGEGDAMTLVVENGRWKMATDPIDFYNQRTPAEALRSFIRAVESRRYKIVLRFVPKKWAETMTVQKLRKQWEGEKQLEVKRLLKSLRANLSAPIRQSGNSATMAYGDRHEVRFVREDGVWKIEDPD